VGPQVVPMTPAETAYEQVCPAGTYLLAATTTGDCTPCPANTYSAAGSSQVTDCKCLAGYTGADGTECSACPIASYKEAPGVGSCTACPVGTSSAVASSSKTYCTCIVGFTASSNGDTCTACASGTYKDVTGAFICQTCPMGTSSATGSDTVTDCICNAGYEASVNGVTCAACTVGTFKPSTGVGQCTACPVQMTSIEAGTECIPQICPSGMQFDTQNVCTDCPIDTYCIGGNLNVCPANMISASGSATCSCKLGYYTAT